MPSFHTKLTDEQVYEEESGDDENSDDDASFEDSSNILYAPTAEASDSTGRSEKKVYKRRWFILFVFSLNCIGNAVSFTSIAGIADIACTYYNVQPHVLNWIPNSFLLIYVFIGLPSAFIISSLGLRRSLIIGSSLNAITCSLHFAGSYRDGFPFVMVGQLFAAVGVGAVLQIPGKLATVWFGVNEHATATSIGYLVNILGMAIGYLQSTQMVPNTPHDIDAVGEGIFYMNLTQLIFVLVTLVLTYGAFRSRPPSAPSNLLTSVNEGEKGPSFITCLRLLVEDRDFNLYAQAFGLVFGIFCYCSIVLNEMLSTKMIESEIGWLGFTCNMFGIIGMLVCGIIVDKYKCYKAMSVFLVCGGLIDWTAFTIVFLLTDYQILLFTLYALFGFFTIPLTSVGVEQCSVTTYPVPEEISGGIMLMFGNLYGFVGVLFLGEWVAQGRSEIVCYITVALLFVSLLFVCASKLKLKKLHSQYQRIEASGSLDQVA